MAGCKYSWFWRVGEKWFFESMILDLVVMQACASLQTTQSVGKKIRREQPHLVDKTGLIIV